MGGRRTKEKRVKRAMAGGRLNRVESSGIEGEVLGRTRKAGGGSREKEGDEARYCRWWLCIIIHVKRGR